MLVFIYLLHPEWIQAHIRKIRLKLHYMYHPWINHVHLSIHVFPILHQPRLYATSKNLKVKTLRSPNNSSIYFLDILDFQISIKDHETIMWDCIGNLKWMNNKYVGGGLWLDRLIRVTQILSLLHLDNMSFEALWHLRKATTWESETNWIII